EDWNAPAGKPPKAAPPKLAALRSSIQERAGHFAKFFSLRAYSKTADINRKICSQASAVDVQIENRFPDG
ncbi:MAG: hypothetical protein VX075_14285, partial [Pseudomonadota bacterium]|nr:hypothetical protein [Pseudomonadota bacterium]